MGGEKHKELDCTRGGLIIRSGNTECLELPDYQNDIYTLKEHLEDLMFYFEDYVKVKFDDIKYQKKEIYKVYTENAEENRDVRVMVAHDDRYFISKVISGLDTATETVVDGVNLLFDVRSMRLASILPTEALTYMRTSVMNALGLKYLAPSSVNKIAILGAGKLCFYCLPLISTLFPDREIWIYDTIHSKANAIRDRLEVIVPVMVAKSLEEAVRDSEVIIALTPSRKPIIFHNQLKEGIHINTLGADTRGKQQIDPRIIKTSKILVDDIEQSLKYGELNTLYYEGQISERDIYGTIFEVIKGEKKGRENNRENTLFDSSGIPIEDFIACIWYTERIHSELG